MTPEERAARALLGTLHTIAAGVGRGELGPDAVLLIAINAIDNGARALKIDRSRSQVERLKEEANLFVAGDEQNL